MTPRAHSDHTSAQPFARAMKSTTGHIAPPEFDQHTDHDAVRAFRTADVFIARTNLSNRDQQEAAT